MRFVILCAAVLEVAFWALGGDGVAGAVTARAETVSRASGGTFAQDRLTVRTRTGAEHVFRVEIAATPAQQSLGLMHRSHLPADAGMLFIYDPPRAVTMWMKNTRIALDMLFAGANGTVFHIVENATPYSEDLIPAPGPAAYVLELPGGTVARLGLGVGDRLVR